MAMVVYQKRKYSGAMVGRGGAITVRNPLYGRALRKKAVIPRLPARFMGYYRRSGNYGRFGRNSNQEMKYFDTALGFNFDTTMEVPASGQLALIPQGDTAVTRDGYKCVIKSVSLKGNILLVNQTPTGDNIMGTVHLWLMQDMQTNGAAAAVTDAFITTNADTALPNIENGGRFRCLKKWRVDLNPQTITGGAGLMNGISRFIEFYTKCNIPLQFNGPTGAITEIRTNNLFLIAGCSGQNFDDIAAFRGVSRLRFTD